MDYRVHFAAVSTHLFLTLITLVLDLKFCSVGHRRLARSLALCQSRWKQGSVSSTRIDSREGTPRPGSRGPAAKRRESPSAEATILGGRTKARNGPDFGPAGSEAKASKLATITVTTTRDEPSTDILPDLNTPQRGVGQAKGGEGPRKYLLVDDNDINLRVSFGPQHHSSTSMTSEHISGHTVRVPRVQLPRHDHFVLSRTKAHKPRFSPPS